MHEHARSPEAVQKAKKSRTEPPEKPEEERLSYLPTPEFLFPYMEIKFLTMVNAAARKKGSQPPFPVVQVGQLQTGDLVYVTFTFKEKTSPGGFLGKCISKTAEGNARIHYTDGSETGLVIIPTDDLCENIDKSEKVHLAYRQTDSKKRIAQLEKEQEEMKNTIAKYQSKTKPTRLEVTTSHQATSPIAASTAHTSPTHSDITKQRNIIKQLETARIAQGKEIAALREEARCAGQRATDAGLRATDHYESFLAMKQSNGDKHSELIQLKKQLSTSSSPPETISQFMCLLSRLSLYLTPLSSINFRTHSCLFVIFFRIK